MYQLFQAGGLGVLAYGSMNDQLKKEILFTKKNKEAIWCNLILLHQKLININCCIDNKVEIVVFMGFPKKSQIEILKAKIKLFVLRLL